MKETTLKYRPIVFWLPFLSMLFLWIVYYLDWTYYLEWKSFGIVPKTFKGLQGILFSPFLHGSFQHLIHNSLALIVVLPLTLYYYHKHWRTLILGGILLSGLGTWLIANGGNHIGASGLVYVLTAYLFFTGIRSKQYRLMAIAFLVVILYGSSVWYMFPDVEQGISWEGHLAGFLTGTLFSFVLEKPQVEPIYTYDWQKPDYDYTQDEFMLQFDKNGNFNPLPLLRKDVDGYIYNDTFHRKGIAKIKKHSNQSFTFTIT